MVCCDLTFSRSLPVQFSIFSAELGAISHALDHVIIRCLPCSAWLLLQSVVTHISTWLRSSLSGYLTWVSLSTFVVPSHCGIIGNKAADAATAAACHDVVGDFPIPAADHCSAICRALLVFGRFSGHMRL